MDKVIQTRIDEKLDDAINRYCEQNPEITRSAVMRMALRDWEPLKRIMEETASGYRPRL